MRPAAALMTGLLALGWSVGASALQQPSNSKQLTEAEKRLRHIDLRHAEAVQSGDADALSELLHPDFTTHLPNGRFAARGDIMAAVRRGAFAEEKFARSPERLVLTGDVGFVMGVERLEAPPPLATRGERTRRYTNVYIRQGGRWQLVARHFNFLP